MREAVKAGLLDMAEFLTVEAGYASTFKDQVYSALIHHVRAKFLKGASLGLAERADVDFAWKMLQQVKAKVGAIPGLITSLGNYSGSVALHRRGSGLTLERIVHMAKITFMGAGSTIFVVTITGSNYRIDRGAVAPRATMSARQE